MSGGPTKKVEWNPSVRTPGELFWVDLQPFLLSRGYQLRPRLDPNWKPSWGSSRMPESSFPEDCFNSGGPVIDAVRVKDGRNVALKKVMTKSDELPIAMFFNSKKLREDPRNSLVPVLDVLLIPANDDWALLIMPMLYNFESLAFRRVGEFCEAVLQYLEGLELMHEHNIAHRDPCYYNLMMDASRVIPKGAHFCNRETHDGVSPDFEWRERWKVRPVKYYIIDFDISARYDSKDALITGFWGQDKTVPERSATIPYNAFKLDIYQMGNVILRMVKEYRRLAMFEDLARQMTNVKPELRPTASESVQICKEIIAKLNFFSIRRRIWKIGPLGCEPHFLAKLAIQFFGWNPKYL